MDFLKKLEDKYSKNHHDYFEDLAALLFCIEFKLSHGVNRRVNQAGIEADPINCDGQKIAFQAKYYGEGVKLSERKADLLKSVREAAREGVGKLIFYTNKDLSSNNIKNNDSDSTKPREKPAYEQEIYTVAASHNMTIEWRTKSSINTSLEKPEYQYIRKIYFGTDENEVSFVAFYEYVMRKICAYEKTSIFGAISLKDGYIEPNILVKNKRERIKAFLYTWAKKQSDLPKDRIMVLYGEPGHGKTSLCYKAMYDFYKEGWLSGIVENVFCISLNPTDTQVVNEKFDIKNILCWGDIRENIMQTCDFNNSLVFFDGFDELLDSIPNLTLSEFINNAVKRFVQATKAKVVITTRRMSIEREFTKDTINHGLHIYGASEYRLFEIQPLSFKQQIDWIRIYTLFCQEQAAKEADSGTFWKDKVTRLEKYEKHFSSLNLEGRLAVTEENRNILSIPIIFRIIVDNQLNISELKGSVDIYENLFSITWDRHPKEFSINTNITKESTIAALAEHAMKCFENNADSAIADIGYSSFWTYQFYTRVIDDSNAYDSPYIGVRKKLRVGFMHRSFYQYFLAKRIILALLDAQTSSSTDRLINFLTSLSKRRLDATTLDYVKDLYARLSEGEKAYSEENFLIIKKVIKETDAILPEISEMDCNYNSPVTKRITPLEAGNNLFINIGSLYTLTEHSNLSELYSPTALRFYSFSGVKLRFWNLEGYNFFGDNLDGTEFLEVLLNKAHLERSFLKQVIFENTLLKEACFRGTNLEGSRFTGSSLTRANFKRAIIKDVLFERCFLDNAHLEYTNIYNTSFGSSNLNGICLNNSRLQNVSFIDAHMENAQFCNAILDDIILNRAHLKNADFKEAVFRKTKFEKAQMSRSCLENAYLIGSSLFMAQLQEAQLQGATLKDVYLKDALLNRAHLEGAILDGVNLNLAKLEYTYMQKVRAYNIQCVRASMIYANLEGAFLNRASLGGAHLEGANLSRAHLEGANLYEAHLEGANLSEAHLEGANLCGAYLEGATLYKTHLEGANLGGAHFKGTIFDRTYIEEAILDDDLFRQL